MKITRVIIAFAIAALFLTGLGSQFRFIQVHAQTALAPLTSPYEYQYISGQVFYKLANGKKVPANNVTIVAESKKTGHKYRVKTDKTGGYSHTVPYGGKYFIFARDERGTDFKPKEYVLPANSYNYGIDFTGKK